MEAPLKKKTEASLVRLRRKIYFVIVVFLRIPCRMLFGKRKRNELFRRWGWRDSGIPVRDFFFRLCRIFHTTFFLKFLQHEPDVVSFVKKVKGDLFLDVGANIGFYSLLLSKNFKKVISVEPHPDNMNEIKKNLSAFRVGNVECVTKAVSNTNGVGYLLVSEGNGGHALGQRIRPRENLPVETVTLSELLKKYDLIDLVKVDVEGAEWNVLAGARDIMYKIKAWVIELHGLERKAELESLLESYGYSRRWLDYNHIFAWKGENEGRG